MIIVYLYEEGSGKLIIDYGMNTETNQIVTLPQLPLSWVGVGHHEDDMLHYDSDIGEYVLNDENA